jgi:RNA polymerase-interacting CarD/CdnL/TRCF family regulator
MRFILNRKSEFIINDTILYPWEGRGAMMKIWNKNTGPDFKQK